MVPRRARSRRRRDVGGGLLAAPRDDGRALGPRRESQRVDAARRRRRVRPGLHPPARIRAALRSAHRPPRRELQAIRRRLRGHRRRGARDAARRPRRHARRRARLSRLGRSRRPRARRRSLRRDREHDAPRAAELVVRLSHAVDPLERPGLGAHAPPRRLLHDRRWDRHDPLRARAAGIPVLVAVAVASTVGPALYSYLTWKREEGR